MGMKKFKGAPFGTQTSRFNVSGIHPQSKPPGTFTQVPYCKKSLSWAGLAPGCYDINVRDAFNDKVVKLRAEGPGWERQYRVAKLAKMPHLLHRGEAKAAEERKRRLGPGSYEHTDFCKKMEQKPSSTRGICQTKAKRFVNKEENFPGPGTYGEGGIPSAAAENRQNKSASTIGMLDSGGLNDRSIGRVGCELPPTQYNKKTFIDLICNKVVSKRGPYDLFSGSRSKGVSTGHYAVNPASTTLGPGSYNIDSFVQNWNSEHKRKHGIFSKMHVEISGLNCTAGERIYCKTLSQCPRAKEEPGPGQYSPRVYSINVAKNKPNAPAFGTSANRYRMERTSNNVGAGRYNIAGNAVKKTNGTKCVFKSSTDRFVEHERQIFLKERIRAKDIAPEKRIPFVIK